jgi:aminoglycoside phosphotransferase (APT) family kinase protein
MDLVKGRTYSNGALPEFDSATRRRMYEQLVDTLADLHWIEPSSIGLEDFGKPGNYFERQVARWTRQYRDSQTDDIPDMERLIAFLPETLPTQFRTSVVHGDYRIDNVSYERDGTLAAVLDWELATLGDPLADFSYLAMQWVMPAADEGAGLAGLDLEALGIPTLDEIVERYAKRSAVPVTQKLDWYFAYNLFRLAGIVQGIKKRVIDGTASHARAAEMAKRVPVLASAALDFARRAGAPA